MSVCRTSVLSTLFLVLVFVCAASSSGQMPTGLRIAVNVLENQAADDYEVYTVGLDGSGLTNVTRNKDVAWTYYSIPGRLLFISDRGSCKRCYFLYEAEPDGRNPRKVSNLQLEDSWMGSRNAGKELIVAGRIDTRVRYQLFLIDRESGRYSQLTNEPAAAFRDPVFSPDGKRIAYVYKKNRMDRTEIEELYVMNSDGSGRRKLTTYPPADPLGKQPGYKVGPPHWNSKHGFITYQSNQAGKQSIYAVSPDGKRQWKLTDSQLDEGWHDWSPDGEWLVFDSRDASTGRYDVYLMERASKKITKVTGASPLKYHQAPVFLDVRK